MQKNFIIFIGQMSSEIVEAQRKKGGIGSLDSGREFDR